MTKKNLSIAALLIFLITCCSKKKELNGYWYGEFKFDKERSPALLKFENDIFIDFFSPFNDTTSYKSYGNKIYFDNGFDEKHELKIKLENNLLSTLDSNSNVIITLKKRKADNFVFDYLNDKTLTIDLPTGNGLENKFGHFYPFKWPLYLTIKNKSLVANFLDTTIIVDSNYYKTISNKQVFFNEYSRSANRNRISLIADKKLKVSDIDLMKKQLKILGFSKIEYLLKAQSYDKINVLTSRLGDLTEKEFNDFNSKENPLPPPPPSFTESLHNFEGKLMFIKVEGSTLIVDDSIVGFDSFVELIKPKILSGKKLAIFYHISEKSTYENFIRFNEVIYNTYYDIRDDYLTEKYQKKFRRDYNYRSEAIIDAKKKYPLIFWQLDSLEYKKLKYNL